MPDVIQRADVGMVQRRDGPRLALEALFGLRIVRQMCRQNLERNRAVEPSVAGAVHLAHPTCTGRGDYFIRTNARARGQRHKSPNYSGECDRELYLRHSRAAMHNFLCNLCKTLLSGCELRKE